MRLIINNDGAEEMIYGEIISMVMRVSYLSNTIMH